MASLLIQENYSDDDGEKNSHPDEEQDDENFDEKPHSRLLDAISALTGKKRPQATRTIFGHDVSEAGFKTASASSDKIYSALLSSIGESGSHSVLKKQLNTVVKASGVLSAPAPKHLQQQVQRTVLYEGTRKEISKWDPVVADMRKAPQLKFPMQTASQRLVDSHIKFRPVTKFEKAYAEVLAKKKPEDCLQKNKLLTPREEKEIAAMTIEEANARRAELVRMRQLAYQKISKLKWQNKIKSKRYRRAKKKEKEKQLEKELETLAVTDPQALLDRMGDTEKKRVEERGRLRHRQGGKFAKQAKIFAKYDDSKRQQIQDMIEKHKELTKKQELPSSSDDDSGDEDMDSAVAAGESKSNAWMKPSNIVLGVTPAAQPSAGTQNPSDAADEQEREEEANGDEELKIFLGESEGSVRRTREDKLDDIEVEVYNFAGDDSIEQELSDNDTVEEEGGKKNEAVLVSDEKAVEKFTSDDDDEHEVQFQKDRSIEDDKINEVKENTVPTVSDTIENEESLLVTDDKRKKKNKGVEDLDLPKSGGKKKKRRKNKKTNKADGDTSKSSTATQAEQDLMSVIRGLQASESLVNDDKNGDKKTKRRRKRDSAKSRIMATNATDPKVAGQKPSDILMTIAEAFDDDDVVEEFVEEKKRKIEDETEKDQDVFLPGWGGWTGPGIVHSTKLRERFIKKANPKPRADNYIGHCIISEKPNTAVEKHQLLRLPQGFRSMEHLKNIIDKPLGREFNSESTFKHKIAPKVVVTRAGQILEPISEDILMKKVSKKTEAADIGIDTKLQSKRTLKPQAGRKRKRVKKSV